MIKKDTYPVPTNLDGMVIYYLDIGWFLSKIGGWYSNQDHISAVQRHSNMASVTVDTF